MTSTKTKAGCSPVPLDPLVGQDAARYRWLLARLQAAYDGDTNDDLDTVTVFCSMQFGHRDHRRVEAYITWSDARDEPLNLSAAIDAAAMAYGLRWPVLANEKFQGRP